MTPVYFNTVFEYSNEMSNYIRTELAPPDLSNSDTPLCSPFKYTIFI
jgi:hypothetical protein